MIARKKLNSKFFTLVMMIQGNVISSETVTQEIPCSFGPSSIFNIKAQRETSTRRRISNYIKEDNLGAASKAFKM